MIFDMSKMSVLRIKPIITRFYYLEKMTQKWN